MDRRAPRRRKGYVQPAKGKKGKCPTGKPRYRDQDQAVATARYRAGIAGHDLYVYPCDVCKGHHITSETAEQYAERRAGGWATRSR